VRDFIDVYFASWDWHFPTFNVADSCITVGAALLLLSGLFSRSEPAAEAAPPGGARERVD
jgi:signal peptidase II